MKKYLFAVSFLALTASAHAADVYYPGMKDDGYYPSDTSIFRWTGLYAGVIGGYADFKFGRPDDKSSPTQKFDGGIGGVELGYNRGIGNGFMLGVEADVMFGDLKQDPIHDGGNILVQSDVDMFGTVRARAGYAIGRFLPFVTGGMAWMKGSTGETCVKYATGGHCVKTGPYTETDNFSEIGWAYGGGVEVALTGDLSLKVEYLRLDFGTDMHDLGPKSSDRKEDITADVVRGGLNYRF